MNDRISISIDAGVADVRLVRADKMNALDPAMFKALADAATRLKGDKSVRAVVLSGEGRAFCAGLDMSSFASVGGDNKLAARTHGLANLWQYAVYGWREVPVPVIAAVHGVAFGGGFQIALGAYSLNNMTAKPDASGAVTMQFGGCEKTTTNCLPTVKGWNYTVRLYRPRKEILDGSWKLPQPQPVN